MVATDNRPKSPTKGEKISLPVTIVECPPLMVAGIACYRRTASGLQKMATLLADKAGKAEGPGKADGVQAKNENIGAYDDVRLLVRTNPDLTSIGSKKPVLLEIALGGSPDEKKKLALDFLGKDIMVTDVLEPGMQVDAHGITKGKGFQGTVKRYGIPIRQHKAEKTKRGVGNLGGWTPKRVHFTVAQPGKMGYHLRTEYNKLVMKVSPAAEGIQFPGGIVKYGQVSGAYVLLKGSVAGPKKRQLLLTYASRPNRKVPREAPAISYISLRN